MNGKQAPTITEVLDIFPRFKDMPELVSLINALDGTGDNILSLILRTGVSCHAVPKCTL